MRRFQSLTIPSDARGATVAIGNFDGVHLGHQAVLNQTRDAANGTPFGVLTFEPHPREYFAHRLGKDLPPFRLLNAESRANRLEKLGVDLVFEAPFDDALSNLSPEQFCQEILTDAYGLARVVVGADFRFGKGREGSVETLKTCAQSMGFEVIVAQLEQFGDAVISSTNIRAALQSANPRRAAAMLGHWHRIEGEVRHGEKRGRELGYPTANLSIDGLHQPAFGVYAVTVDILTGPDQGTYQGATSIGVRPMFGENRPNCETFLFDFSGDLYGQKISVGLVEYLRGEENFDGLDALIKQMQRDCDQARAILSAL